MPRSRRANTRAAARHSVGREGHHLGQGLQDDLGIGAFKEQVFDYDASVVEMLRDAGAVLIAKLTTGELAAATTGSAGRPRARGIRRRARADRRPARRRRPRPGASASASAPRRADRSSARRRAAASPDCVRRSAASAATA